MKIDRRLRWEECHRLKAGCIYAYKWWCICKSTPTSFHARSCLYVSFTSTIACAHTAEVSGPLSSGRGTRQHSRTIFTFLYLALRVVVPIAKWFCVCRMI